MVFISINFDPFDILMPLATASEILIPEKLPGPIFTITEKFLSILAFFVS